VSLRRLLFASVHGYADPSSGAAWATRDILELLAARGVDCRVVSTGVLDYERETPLDPVLDALGVPARPAAGACEFALGGVRVAVVRTASSRVERSSDPVESRAFLALAERALDDFRPRVLLTYGGHPANLALMARARRRGVPVVFHLHNFAYGDRRCFADASAVLVPSEYSRRYYARRLGLDCAAVPLPVVPARAVAPAREPRYLTFVNPHPDKGAVVFARIAAELYARRPDIPLLVVEGRATADGLAGVRLDLSELRNLHRLPNLSSPRAIYRVTRALLAPSLFRESFGRVAAEALCNGVPVLASDRGALPETLGDAGFVFTVPERCTPTGDAVPTAREVAPWVATVERLWDDPGFEAAHRARALAEARRWGPDALAGRYLAFFESLARGD